MKKVLLLLCSVVLIVGVLGGCSKINDTAEAGIKNNIQNKKNETAEVFKKNLEKEAAKSEFGKKEIKEFLLEADSWQDDIFNNSFEVTSEVIGLVDREYIVNKIKNNKLEKLKKYYSKEVIKGEMAKRGLVYVGNDLGEMQKLCRDITRIPKNPKIKLLLDEKDKKIINIEKRTINYDDDYIDNNFDLDTFGTKYELCKNEKGNWIITNEEDYMYKNGIIEKSISLKDSKTTASSNLKEYSPNLLLDNNKKTAWVEGVKGDGIGEWIKLDFKKDIEISNIAILNGYGKTVNLYYKNNRVKKVKIEFSNGEHLIKKLICDMPRIQVIKLPKFIKTNYVKLTILEVEKGTEYKDTCISDLYFFNKVSGNKETVKEKEQGLIGKSDFNLEMEVYKLNKKKSLSDDEIKLMINYLGKINWVKYHELEREKKDLGEFDIDALLRYDNYTSKELLYIYEACLHSDGAGAEALCEFLYELHKKYSKESMRLYTTNPQYKELIDMIENYYAPK